MFRELLFLTVLFGAFGDPEPRFEFRQDSDYVFLYKLYEDVEYISVDGVNISKAGEGSNCVAPNDCWQLIRRGRYLIVLGVLKGTQAAFTVQPVNPSNRLSVGVQYKKTGMSQYPPLRNGTISVLAKELHEHQPLLHILMFSADIGKVEIVKGMSNTPSSDSMTLIGKSQQPDEHIILFTGRLENKVREMKIKFTTGRVDNIKIIPYTKPDHPVMLLTFIDYANSFKAK
ncbi:hypothetical protein AAHC03_022564 [Spirometra sp. Aus1]